MRLLELAPGRWAHASGALWLSESRTVLLADVHLGYGWALRRRGQLGPTEDARVRQKLYETVRELQPEKIVFLGDVVHASRPGVDERVAVESTLQELANQAKLILIPGNHDRRFARDYGASVVEIAEAWSGSGLLAVHGHTLPVTTEHLVLGHIHPALSIRDHAGACQKAPVFVASSRVTILPAFSPFSAGSDIFVHMPALVSELIDPEMTRVVAASGRRVVDLGVLAEISRLV